MTGRFVPFFLVTLFILLGAGCSRGGGSGGGKKGGGTGTKTLERQGCQSCHQPLGFDGQPGGLEEAHPWAPLSCTDCHGGNPDTVTLAEAHVPSRGLDRETVRSMTAVELDSTDPDYLRFLNPGDLRVMDETCGECHPGAVEKVSRSMMNHTSGEITVPRYRASQQTSTDGTLGAVPLFDPNFDPDIPTTVQQMSRFNPPDLQGPLRDHYGAVQDHYMATSCFRCHTADFGENKFRGDFRSSGCTACHMPYNDDGTSQSADILIDHTRPSHPIRHRMTSAIPTNQCTHCHYRGGRLGISFQGYRESGGSGFNPTNTDTLGVDLHGHDADYYITDEDVSNGVDETPPDVHHTAGMHCIDCHTVNEIHGDGHLYSDTVAPLEIMCETCHGTVDAVSDFKTRRGEVLPSLSRDVDGEVMLALKLEERSLRVPQVTASVDPISEHYSQAADDAMGRDGSGFSHTDDMECYTCHSAWTPSCYGCHVTVDFGGTAKSLIDGLTRTGRPTAKRKWVTTDDLVLMRNTRGKISPSMPAERFFLTVRDEAGDLLIDRQPRTGPGGLPGHGQRAYQPHTVAKQSSFSNCTRCHPATDNSNADLIDVVHGFGSNRFPETDGNGRVWKLDAILGLDYSVLITSGHDEPSLAGPLSQATIEAMRAITVDPDDE